MTFREKIKRVFTHSEPQARNQKAEDKPQPEAEPNPTTTGPNGGNGGGAAAKPRKWKLRRDRKPKIEVYKPYQVPPSKFRGPFDPDHMKRMADYAIPQEEQPTEDRPLSMLSMLSELSPTQTREPKPWDEVDDDDTNTRKHDAEEEQLEVDVVDPLDKPTAMHLESPPIDQTPDRASEKTAFTHDGGGSLSSLTLVTPPINDTGRQEQPESHFPTSRITTGKDVFPAVTLHSHSDTNTPILATSGLGVSLTAVEARA